MRLHVFRWDLDKTYLDTDFDSVRGLIRTAMEPATAKRNVPGSAALARALLRCTPDARMHVVSGSPTQMRAVLEEKLALDGLKVDRLVLKDNLGNLKRGRIRAVRGQLGYKLPNLLEMRVGLAPATRETLFGDDAEVDALVYALYADAVSGRISGPELARVMEAGGAYSDSIRRARALLRTIEPADVAERIFIHLDRATPPARFHALGRRVVPVFSWFQAAVVLWAGGRLDPTGLGDVARAAAAEGNLDEIALAGLTQDLVLRGELTLVQARGAFEDCADLAPVAPHADRALRWLGAAHSTRPEPPPADYLRWMRAPT